MPGAATHLPSAGRDAAGKFHPTHTSGPAGGLLADFTAGGHMPPGQLYGATLFYVRLADAASRVANNGIMGQG